MNVPILVLTMAAIAATSAHATENNPDPTFEKPAAVKHLRLGRAQTQPVSYKEIRCSYFGGVMVKEWDQQEIGDKEISYVLTQGAAKPACQKAALPGERKLPTGDLTVYFLGYAAGAIFLGDADGANDTIGFYVFDPMTGRRRFTDTIKLDSKFAGISAEGDTLRLGYTRALTGPCSVVTDGADCWSKIARQAGFSGPAPDCADGYRESGRKFAEEACRIQRGDRQKCLAEQLTRRAERDKAPSVVAFDVTAAIGSDDTTKITPTGGPAQCWPSD
jgi:hypothetical protein